MQYYDMSLHFYWNYQNFQNAREKNIWWLHCQGLSRREISEQLKLEGTIISDSLVQIIVSRLKKILHSQLWPSSEGSSDRNNIEEEPDFL